MNFFLQGGLFMWPLAVCSILMVAVVADRFYVFSRTMRRPLTDFDNPNGILKELRTRMTMLHTIIVISPMLGLLGTVTGLMKCFNLLGMETIVSDTKEISLGISEALVTTAVGLLITVVATIFYNYFNSRLEEYVFDYHNLPVKED